MSAGDGRLGLLGGAGCGKRDALSDGNGMREEGKRACAGVRCDGAMDCAETGRRGAGGWAARLAVLIVRCVWRGVGRGESQFRQRGLPSNGRSGARLEPVRLNRPLSAVCCAGWFVAFAAGTAVCGEGEFAEYEVGGTGKDARVCSSGENCGAQFGSGALGCSLGESCGARFGCGALDCSWGESCGAQFGRGELGLQFGRKLRGAIWARGVGFAVRAKAAERDSGEGAGRSAQVVACAV